VATAFVAANKWNHYALQQDAVSTELYVDGALIVSKPGFALPFGPGSSTNGSFFPVHLAGVQTANASNYAFQGKVGPHRVSSDKRYSSSFAPKWNWASDASTIAVWNMSEGQGQTVDDSAGTRDMTFSQSGTPSWFTVQCP
jgi:hypothetical protein